MKLETLVVAIGLIACSLLVYAHTDRIDLCVISEWKIIPVAGSLQLSASI